MSKELQVTVVEVGPRDGFQAIRPFIPTELKIDLIRQLYSAGLNRIEVTAFVSHKALRQMADAVQVLDASHRLPNVDAQVLVPNRRYAERAVAAGARHLAFVISASEKHNMSNVRRTIGQSIDDYGQLLQAIPRSVKLRLNLATAFDCPFDGTLPCEVVIALLAALIPMRPDVEVALCDTTGRVTPGRVAKLFHVAKEKFCNVRNWVFHGHDTYGLGAANVLAAFDAGVRVFDASFGGLGGCPFAPGATGNIATEDLVWIFERMGIATGVDLDALLRAAEQGAAIPGALPGGRVRDAVRGAREAAAPC